MFEEVHDMYKSKQNQQKPKAYIFDRNKPLIEYNSDKKFL